ncbi:uncharacterized protein LOC120629695 [Pararge aegeria]|uniref:uncharacterized protein LOC120629695 n=1 Tax=Pararge aegeria TaxID=116150 RepID=UPI0019D0F30F|nr:uncharacterized protein LOC120629695 [Pararge aegeria]
MDLQRTPPTCIPKCTSSPDLSSIDDSCFVGMRNKELMRKRKRDCDEGYHFTTMEEKFNEHVAAWCCKADESISNTVSTAIKTALSNELLKVTASLADINSTVLGLRSDNSSIKDSLNDVKERLHEMDKSMCAANDRQDLFDTRLCSLEKRNALTETLPEQLLKLENKMAAMEQQSRECNIEVANLPERRNENLVGMIINLGAAVNCPITPANIIAVHRVPHATTQSRPKNVIVKLSSRILRDNIIAACRAKRYLNTEHLLITGTRQAIYVNEHLTLMNKLLFRECREHAKKHDYAYTWVKHGTILARKTDTSPVLAIRTKEDIVSKLK